MDGVSNKIDEILKKLNDWHVEQQYREYFMNPIVRIYGFYQDWKNSYGGWLNKNEMKKFMTKCENDQPLHALEWLSRTMHKSDPTVVKLLDMIFAKESCAAKYAPDYMLSIYWHAVIAAYMDQMCYATFIRNILSMPKCKAKANKYLTSADSTKKKIYSLKEFNRRSEYTCKY